MPAPPIYMHGRLFAVARVYWINTISTWSRPPPISWFANMALTVGHAYSGKATLRRPADSSEILQTIRNFNSNDTRQHIIIQELIIYLGMLIKLKPELFADMQTIRVGHILQLIIARQKRQTGSALDQAFNEILSLAPYQLAGMLEETLADYGMQQNAIGRSGDLAL